jgi:DNA-binding NtrC family response regulator
MLMARTNSEILQRVARDLVKPLELVTRQAIESAMILCEGNKTEVAFRLGISRPTLMRHLKQYRREDGN